MLEYRAGTWAERVIAFLIAFQIAGFRSAGSGSCRPVMIPVASWGTGGERATLRHASDGHGPPALPPTPPTLQPAHRQHVRQLLIPHSTIVTATGALDEKEGRIGSVNKAA
jgi:hypothetical protein